MSITQEVIMVSNTRHPIKILVIEDDKSNTILIHEMLSESGIIAFDIHSADQLKAGLDLLAKKAFDVVLLDLNLPDSYGLDTFIRLQTQMPEIPVVILTGLDDETATQALQMGAQDYLLKGRMVKDSLIRSLNYAIERQRLRIEQRFTEKALRESENKYRELVENLNEGILIVDKDSYTTFVNQIIGNMLGYTIEEMMGKHLFSFMDKESIEVYNNNAERRKHGISEQHESKFIRKDGTIIYATVMTSSLLDSDRRYKGTISCIADITDLKRVEMALKREKDTLAKKVANQTAELRMANIELMEADQLKDEFLANMSHELRTPLTSILGMSEALQKNVYGSLNEKQLQCIQLVKDSGNHLLNLINDILDITKINAGKLELEIHNVIIESFCQNSLQFIMQEAHKKLQKVITNIDSSVKTMQGDELRLKQMLVNLLSNAVKFTPKGGTIGLEVVGDIENKKVYFTVWDTGVGIRKEDMKKLFKPFTQLDSSLSRQYAGTGLGLALINKIVELHKGKMSVDSEVGKGSRFTVSLPWELPVDQAKPSNDLISNELAIVSPISIMKLEQEIEANESLILLVEDEEGIIKLVSDVLLYIGYRIVTVRDGNDVIKKLEEKRPDLILMDIQLPNINGFDLIRFIRSDDILSDIPIVVLTGLAMQGDRERCLEAGANDYMSKPIKLDMLVRAIDTHLKHSMEKVIINGKE
jgi:PAS domain S-box-containing protein